ncbi:sulfotransferase [Asticcacaulis sp. EMRT-3]|uniref:tetratricopeptide repeat-containing sulfotransferase family protein n=1 Tax=Asticcacaulis sp. EMRT-3 TaxID=3040349 RepID=UPI0024AEC090|nr:sulfotransferase [Asticcacaulis sp. EMRT-3]MDI7775170.1 sulfotransferase [Asticcacaulis sp. EMRT-3]
MPQSLHPLVLKGRQAFQAGDHAGALSLCSMRLNEAPEDLLALELKAVILQARGDLKGAEAVMRQAIACDPACDWAHNDLTRLLHATGQTAAAEQAARAAVIACPDDPQAHMQLGVLFGERDDLAAAEWHNRRALELAGPHAQILIHLGLNLYHQGKVDEALDALLRAHALEPKSAIIMAHVSRCFEACRDMADAYQWLERAEAIARTTGEDFTLLRALYLANGDQPQAALDLIDAAKTPLAGPAQLDRARLLDKLGRHDEAWQAFVSAKTKLASEMRLGYDAAAVQAEFDGLKRVFTHDTLMRLPKATQRKDVAQPVFILGFPRSGTTLIEQMLSAHPDVAAGGELRFAHAWQEMIRANLPGDQPFPDKITQTLAADLRHFPGLMRDDYLNRASISGLSTGVRFFTDKMPLNDVYLPLIRIAFPQAAVLRMVRHPLDVLLSMLSHNLTHGYEAAYSPDTIADHMLAMHALNRHYDEALETPVITVRYEDFVADQRGHTLRILGQLDLGFHEACLRFHENRRHAPTPSYAQVTRPLNNRSIGRWKPYRRHLEPLIDRLAPLIEELGYRA